MVYQPQAIKDPDLEFVSLISFVLHTKNLQYVSPQKIETRMHSSRMRTGRLLTVSHSIPCVR